MFSTVAHLGFRMDRATGFLWFDDCVPENIVETLLLILILNEPVNSFHDLI